ncbi:MAG: hypothetical protein ACE5R6_03445 [Candidatus Heimdallarchaeota archaeon]
MIPQTQSDTLISSQQNLFVQIKRSHRLFLAQLYVTLLIFPLFAIFFLLLIPYLPSDRISLFSPLIGLILVPVAATIWLVKKSYTFTRSSARYFNRIEQTPESPQLIIGLTSYVNHLLNLLQPQFLQYEPSPATLSESLERLEKRLKQQIYLEFATLVGLALFILNMQFFFSHAQLPIHLGFYVIIGGLIAVFGIRLRISFQWRPLAKQWIQGFYALNEWGENLERSIFRSQEEVGS